MSSCTSGEYETKQEHHAEDGQHDPERLGQCQPEPALRPQQRDRDADAYADDDRLGRRNRPVPQGEREGRQERTEEGSPRHDEGRTKPVVAVAEPLPAAHADAAPDGADEGGGDDNGRMGGGEVDDDDQIGGRPIEPAEHCRAGESFASQAGLKVRYRPGGGRRAASPTGTRRGRGTAGPPALKGGGGGRKKLGPHRPRTEGR